jgi:hypothetical protein
MHIMDYYSGTKNKIMSFAGKMMESVITMLTEVTFSKRLTCGI